MVLYYAVDVSKCSAVLRGSDLEVGIQPLCQRVRREGNVWAFVDFDQNVTLSAVEYRLGSRHPVQPFLNLQAAGTSTAGWRRALALRLASCRASTPQSFALRQPRMRRPPIQTDRQRSSSGSWRGAYIKSNVCATHDCCKLMHMPLDHYVSQ